MMNYGEYGLTQRLMCVLGKVSPSTIHRTVKEQGIQSFENHNKSNQRYSIINSRKIMSLFVRKKHPISESKKVHSFYNFKGGTGKTSLCYQVSTHLALCGYNVLVVDADPQAHLSASFGYFQHQDFATIYDSLFCRVPIEKVIQPIFEGLDCVPSNLSLTRIEESFHMLPFEERETILSKHMENLKEKYDFILFDANPGINHTNRNILYFTDVLNIVCETQPYSINGLKVLINDTKKFFERIKKPLPEITVIPNKYELKSTAASEGLSGLNTFFTEYLIKDFVIRKSEEFPRSARDQLPLSFFCKTNSIALEDISDLIVELIKLSEVKGDQLEFAA